MRPRFWFTLVVSCFTCAALPDSFVQADPSAAELLAAYEKHLQLPERLHYQAREEVRYTGPLAPTPTVGQQGVIKVWFDPKRSRITIDGTTQVPGTKSSSRQFNDFLYPETGALVIIRDGKTNKVKAVTAYLGPVPETEKTTAKGLRTGSLHGFIDGEYFPTILQESKLTVSKNSLNGVDCWVLEGESPRGTYAIWMTANEEYRPLRFSVNKGADSWYIGQKKVKSFTGRPPWRPKAVYQGIRKIVDWKQGKKQGASGWPETIVETVTEDYANGQKVTFETTITLTEVQFTPDFDKENPFRIGSDIPNGMFVQVNDHPAIDYEWQDGKIVKSLDKEVVADMENASFAIAPWYAGLPIKLIGLSVLVFVLAVVLWLFVARRRRQA